MKKQIKFQARCDKIHSLKGDIYGFFWLLYNGKSGTEAIYYVFNNTLIILNIDSLLYISRLEDI